MNIKTNLNLWVAFVAGVISCAAIYFLVKSQVLQLAYNITLTNAVLINVFFFILSFTGNKVVEIIRKQDDSKTAFGYLVISVVQLLISMVVALVYLLKATHPSKAMVVAFMLSYFIFAIANTLNILKVLNSK